MLSAQMRTGGAAKTIKISNPPRAKITRINHKKMAGDAAAFWSDGHLALLRWPGQMAPE